MAWCDAALRTSSSKPGASPTLSRLMPREEAGSSSTRGDAEHLGPPEPELVGCAVRDVC